MKVGKIKQNGNEHRFRIDNLAARGYNTTVSTVLARPSTKGGTNRAAMSGPLFLPPSAIPRLSCSESASFGLHAPSKEGDTSLPPREAIEAL